jgi:hypothetical protein
MSHLRDGGCLLPATDGYALPPKEHSRLSRTPPRLQLRLPLRRRVDRKRARPLPAEVHAEYCGFEVHLLRFPWYHPGPEAVEPALPELRSWARWEARPWWAPQRVSTRVLVSDGFTAGRWPLTSHPDNCSLCANRETDRFWTCPAFAVLPDLSIRVSSMLFKAANISSFSEIQNAEPRCSARRAEAEPHRPPRLAACKEEM